jgi:predicted enzyme related to lactoylglutathione lyase
MPRVVHFEIPADDPDRAARFYETVFGWRIKKWDGPIDYWLVTTGEAAEPGIDGGILRRENPGQTVCNTIDVPSVDEYVKKIEEGSGKVIVPKTAIPGVGYIAYFQDTEGIVSGIMEENASAE